MYDLAIISGGPGGYVAAERAGAAGLSVVLFEKRELGGVCLNEGCIPTKTLLYSAKVYNYAKNGGDYGVSTENASFDYGKIVARKDKVVKKLVGGVKAAMKAGKVTVVKSAAMIEGRSAEGITVSAEGEKYISRNLLICAGSEAAGPPFPGLKEAGDVIVTNREILALTEQPKELVVIGGGVIGMEFAAFYNTLGTNVTVVEMLPKILGPLDDEISATLQKIYEKRGIKFCLRCKVTGIEGNAVVYEDPDGKVVFGSKEFKHQTIYDIALVYIQDAHKMGVGVDDGIGLNCPNCGAPIKNLGQKFCEHCGSGVIEVNSRVWHFDAVREQTVGKRIS